jgi:DNA-directed RNA polymerase subunit RPC12/RpoP
MAKLQEEPPQQFKFPCAKCKSEVVVRIFPSKLPKGPVVNFKTVCPNCRHEIVLRFETVDKEAAKK